MTVNQKVLRAIASVTLIMGLMVLVMGVVVSSESPFSFLLSGVFTVVCSILSLRAAANAKNWIPALLAACVNCALNVYGMITTVRSSADSLSIGSAVLDLILGGVVLYLILQIRREAQA